MSGKDYYFYDPERCEFVPLTYPSLERVVYTACVWILCGVVVSGMAVSTLTSTIGTPAEIALKAENNELIDQLQSTKTVIEELDVQIDELAQLDNEMYRSVLGLDPISYEEREGGTGGADIYSEYDLYSQETSEILKWTSENLERLERSINVQKASFSQIKEYYNENREKMIHIPAIKPVKGELLSAFGMRYHPILNYRRMHEGVDFRANVGDDVYATGEGTVKFAGLKGTYGRLLVIDHGFGFETRYAHLSSFASGIRPGTQVKRGDRIAFSGRSGQVEGPHLHYEIYREGQPIDPINYLFADTSPEEYMMYKEIAQTNQKSMD